MDTRETSFPQPAASGRRVAALEGVRGRVGFELDGRLVAVLEIADGRVKLVQDQAPVKAWVIWKDEDDIKRFLRGELNLVVTALQGRLALDGDNVFAIKVMHGLCAAPPLATDPSKGG